MRFFYYPQLKDENMVVEKISHIKNRRLTQAYYCFTYNFFFLNLYQHEKRVCLYEKELNEELKMSNQQLLTQHNFYLNSKWNTHSLFLFAYLNSESKVDYYNLSKASVGLFKDVDVLYDLFQEKQQNASSNGDATKKLLSIIKDTKVQKKLRIINISAIEFNHLYNLF